MTIQQLWKFLRSPLLVVGLCMLWGGCGEAPEAPLGAPRGSLADTLEQVKLVMPASDYVRNDFIPSADSPVPDGPKVKLKIGLPWLLNDEHAPWYLATELGYFAEAGITPEFLPGGPGKNYLAVLAAGTVDIAVVNISTHVTRLRASPTPADLIIVGAVLRRSPEMIMALDKSIPSGEISTRQFTPRDLLGMTVGVEATSRYIVEALLDQHCLPGQEVNYLRVATPDALIMGRVDAMTSWIVNQPRMLEANGYHNWIAIPLEEHGWEDVADVTVVRREMIETNPNLVRRYLWALRRGVSYLLDYPAESAAITQRWATDANLTEAGILRRFELQRDLIIGDGRENLLHVNTAGIERSAARLVRAGVMQLPPAP